uniref:Four and a half LIM domains protein 3 n=2 Tax=Ornithorhynchus anatinus TaxID=9258 RepID=A0A6I8PMY1_ORNAN
MNDLGNGEGRGGGLRPAGWAGGGAGGGGKGSCSRPHFLRRGWGRRSPGRPDTLGPGQEKPTQPRPRRARSVAAMTEGFDCTKCRESLYGRKYIQTDGGPHCVPCYDSHFANTCAECKELIGHDSRELFYEDRHYHEHCFRCFRCDRSLADEPFTCQDNELLCNDCYCSAFSSQCTACGETVMPGSRKLEYGGQTWHEHCFLCSGCEQPLGSRSFVPDKGAHYCVPCYESKFAPRCARCKKTLTQGGVTYRDEPWHRECLVCTGCGTPLAGQQFTSQGDDPYCVACFGERYAPKCSGCGQPITAGLGGGKYLSFEERHWHQDCFSCARCTTSLVGQGFVPDGNQLLCRACSEADH